MSNKIQTDDEWHAAMSVMVDLWDLDANNEDWTKSLYGLGTDIKTYARSRWPNFQSSTNDIHIVLVQGLAEDIEPISEVLDLSTGDLIPMGSIDLLRPMPVTVILSDFDKDVDAEDHGSYNRDVSYLFHVD